MKSTASLLLAWLGIICPVDNSSYAAQPKKDGTEFSALAAKSALIDLIEKSNDANLKLVLENLKKAEPKPGNGDTILLDLWQLNLKEKTFVLSLVSPPILLEYSGVLGFDKSKKWTAKVIKKSQT